MSKDFATNKCVSNPIPANQIVNVNLEWGEQTPPVCTDLISTLQTILDVINNHLNVEFTLDCLNVNNERDVIIQELIGNVCVTENVTPGEIYNILEQEGLNINFCQTDSFNCDSETCITITPCGGTVTFIEQIQALTSRVLGLSDLVKSQCIKIEELESEIAEIKLDNDCCDTSQLESRITLLESNVTTINNNCC